MLQMKLKSCSYLISLLIIFFYSPLFSEEKIDIRKNKKEAVEEVQEDKNKQMSKNYTKHSWEKKG